MKKYFLKRSIAKNTIAFFKGSVYLFRAPLSLQAYLLFTLWNEWWNISELWQCQLGDLEKLPLKWCCFKKHFIYVEKEKTFCTTKYAELWCNTVGYKSLTVTIKRGQLYDVTHWIKSSANFLAVLILYHNIKIRLNFWAKYHNSPTNPFPSTTILFHLSFTFVHLFNLSFGWNHDIQNINIQHSNTKQRRYSDTQI